MIDDQKRLCRAAAIAALAGYELVCLSDGTFVIARWGLLKPLTDLDAVERFLDLASPHMSRSVGVPHG